MLLSLFAVSTSAVDMIQDQALSYNEVAEDIENANFSTVINVLGEDFTYYWGDGYTVVASATNYHRIEILSDGSINIDGQILKKMATTYDSVANCPSTFATDYQWVLWNTSVDHYNVINAALNIVCGFIGLAVGGTAGAVAAAEFAKKAPAFLRIVGGVIVGTLIGAQFPEYYISIRKNQYYKDPIVTSRPIIRNEYVFSHGPMYDREQNYLFTL